MGAVLAAVKGELVARFGNSVTNNDEVALLEEYEEADVFLYEMSRTANVRVRMECMIFELSFDELYDMTVSSLTVIYKGLATITDRLPEISKFFQLVLTSFNRLSPLIKWIYPIYNRVSPILKWVTLNLCWVSRIFKRVSKLLLRVSQNLLVI